MFQSSNLHNTKMQQKTVFHEQNAALLKSMRISQRNLQKY